MSEGWLIAIYAVLGFGSGLLLMHFLDRLVKKMDEWVDKQ